MGRFNKALYPAITGLVTAITLRFESVETIIGVVADHQDLLLLAITVATAYLAPKNQEV